MKRPRKELNTEALIRSIILLGFSTLLLWLVISGKIIIFINPRYTFLSLITGAVMFAMFLIQTCQIFIPKPVACQLHSHTHSHSHNERAKWSYLIFGIPLLIAFILPTTFLDPSLASNKGVSINTQGSITNQSTPMVYVPGSTPQMQAGNNSTNPQPYPSQTQNTQRPLADDLRSAKLINVTDENFVQVMVELNQHYKDYLGKEISLVGFVYRDKDLTPRQFGVLRYVITCCTADASPAGVFCESKDPINLKDGSWVNIKGTLRTEIYQGEESPIIQITSVVPAAKPENPYVYP